MFGRKFVGVKNLTELKVGDIVSHVRTGATYVISAHFGIYVIGVDIMHISNPSEWNVLRDKEK